MKRASLVLAVLAVAAVGGGVWAATRSPTLDALPDKGYPIVDKNGKVIGTYHVPADSAILAEANAQEILYGKRLLDETHRLLPDNVGDEINCNSCHLHGGKLPNGAPYINSSHNYPSYNPRAGKVVTLADRINGCFRRSMNGKPLAVDSPEMKAMLAYMDWLGKKIPAGAKVKIKSSSPIDKTLVPDPLHGAEVYAAQCATCHGDNGEGLHDVAGKMVIPPLWGDHSFNIGAGMARTFTAAAFVKGNMPVSVNGHKPMGAGGQLDDQDVLDVAEYFTHMPRPDFPDKIHDWPNGKKPPDARY